MEATRHTTTRQSVTSQPRAHLDHRLYHHTHPRQRQPRTLNGKHPTSGSHATRSVFGVALTAEAPRVRKHGRAKFADEAARGHTANVA